jgi:hypothetical protein
VTSSGIRSSSKQPIAAASDVVIDDADAATLFCKMSRQHIYCNAAATNTRAVINVEYSRFDSRFSWSCTLLQEHHPDVVVVVVVVVSAASTHSRSHVAVQDVPTSELIGVQTKAGQPSKHSYLGRDAA